MPKFFRETPSGGLEVLDNNVWTHVPKVAQSEIVRLREVLNECKFRLWGQGPSTDPLFARVRVALGNG